jgi:hypothetical protein
MPPEEIKEVAALKLILKENDVLIKRYEAQVIELESQKTFLKQHNFLEEYRIVDLKCQAIDMLIYRWRQMYNQVKDVLNP